jgi:hypothetical protein
LPLRIETKATPSPWAALAPGLLLALLPKCPICLAAYLSLLGVSAGVALTLAHLVPAILVLMTALGVALALTRIVGRKRGRRPLASCAAPEPGMDRPWPRSARW